MKKKILLLLVFGIVIVTCCSCGKKASENTKKDLKTITYDYPFIGFSSKFSYSDDYGFEDLEVKNEEDANYLYFKNSKSNLEYKIEARIFDESLVKEFEDEHKKNEKYKKLKFGKYDGYIYSAENNYTSIVLKLNKEDSFYYVIIVDINRTGEVDSSDNIYIYDSIIEDKNLIEFLSSIEFSTNFASFKDSLGLGENTEKSENNENNE